MKGPAFCVAAVVLSLMSLQAMSLTSLHSFAVAPQGSQPQGGLVQGADGNLYGTTSSGGTNGGNGTVFRITTNGALSSLYQFAGGTNGAAPDAGLAFGRDGNLYGASTAGGNSFDDGTLFRITTNGALTTLGQLESASSGSTPSAGLLLGADGNFYGTTQYGGTGGFGTVFQLSTNGTLTVLYAFTGQPDGDAPRAELTQGTNGLLYGTTSYGGNGDYGTVFQITTNGALTILYSFGTVLDASGDPLDGANPDAGLIWGADGGLYGTTSQGGTGHAIDGGDGAVFRITTDGTLTTVHSFNTTDGLDPEAGVVQGTDGRLYGTTAAGGAYGAGTVFQLDTNGALLTLYAFTGGNDGRQPLAPLVPTRDGFFYGTTAYGGTNDGGSVFKIAASGSFTNLFSFPVSNDGANPSADLALGRDGNFYGTTEDGGTYGDGTIFRISPSGVLSLVYIFGTVTNSFGDPLDGAGAEGTLLLANDGAFYGTTSGGGPLGNGTVFRLTNGVLTTLYSFGAPPDGSTPWSGVVQGLDGALYGTSLYGGLSDKGTAFRISTNGAFDILHSFGGSDGDGPYGLLVGGDGNLYGATEFGGGSDKGTIFQLTPGGSLSTLYSFSGSDGAEPLAGLIQAKDGSLYGTTSAGGTSADGTIFKISTNGVFATVAQFNGANGSQPNAGLVQAPDGSFYGTTWVGGTNDAGVVFQLTTNGILSWVSLGGADGANADSGLVLGPDGNLYSLAENGGVGGFGNIFRVNIAASAPAFLTVTKTSNTLNFTWSALPPRSYQLQFKTNLAQTTWSNLGNSITATNATMRGTDAIGTDPKRFYRVVLLP